MLSVVLPSYNRPEELWRALSCLRAQTLPASEFEVIVVDDGSGEPTQSVIERARASFPPSFQFHGKANGGPASARNHGVARARGDVVVLLQDDIFATPELLEIHRDAHTTRAPSPVVVLGQTLWSTDLARTPFMDFLMEGDQFAFDWISDRENVPYNFFYSSNVSFRRAAFDALGGFDEAFPYAAWEDTDLGLRLIRAGERMVYEPRALAHHHHPTSLASFLKKRRQIGLASAILYRKAPECATMMRYDKRPSPLTMALARVPLSALSAAAQALERRGWDGRIGPRWRRRLYRILLDDEYFRGVAEALGRG